MNIIKQARLTATQRNILNLLMFQGLWFGCVLGGNLVAVLSLAAYVLLYSTLVSNPLQEWKALLAIALVGALADALMAYANIITFDATSHLPVWLACLWLGFGTLFFHGLQWLRSLPWPVVAITGAVAGPATYWSGALLSNNTFPSGLAVFIATYAIAWSILLPLFTHLPRLAYTTETPSP